MSNDEDPIRSAKERLEQRYKLLKQQYEEEVSTFNETKVDNIIKNSGASVYIEGLKERIRAKDKSVKSLENQVKHLEKEVEACSDRAKRAEKKTNHYYKLWRDLEKKRHIQQHQNHLDLSNRDRSLAHDQVLHKASPAPSSIDDSVPPPPLDEAPSIDEILRSPCEPNSFTLNLGASGGGGGLALSANNSHYNDGYGGVSVDSSLNLMERSITPPPLEDINLDDLLGSFRGHQSSSACSPSNGDR